MRTGAALQLAWLRFRARLAPPDRVLRFGPYRIRTDDPGNLHILAKDIFRRRVYHFEASRPDPRILDGGSNIGMSILYFKSVYPKARITGFEPDPAAFPLLQGNLALNGISGVDLRPAALSDKEGVLPLVQQAGGGSRLDPAGTLRVPCVRLRDFLADPVDFLKLNIEGAEWPVLEDCSDRLRSVEQMIVEYHHLPGLPHTLHDILGLLHKQGFEYLLNDFDAETNPGVLPPFRLARDSRYFLLIYARRLP